jgi:hypothetical protein
LPVYIAEHLMKIRAGVQIEKKPYEDEMIQTGRVAMPPEINLGQLLRAHLKVMKTMTIVFTHQVLIDFII